MSWSRPSRIRSVTFVAMLGRCLIALCLWNSPLPVLHAHPDEARDPATQLAEHLRECHWRTCGQDCSCWHIHLVLWGQVQADHRDSESPPPQPRPVDDLAVPCAHSVERDLAQTAQLLPLEFCCVSRVLSDLSAEPVGFSLYKDHFWYQVPIACRTVIRC